MANYKASALDKAGKSKGEQQLPESLFDGIVNEAAMWQTVKAYLANQRQATSHTKTRAYVSGGNKKPWRQKGTGRARQGSTRSAQWRGGGSVFGPRKERNFKQDLPKQVRWLARRSAYNARAEDGAVFVIDALKFDAPKTAGMVSLLKGAGVSKDANVLILTNGNNHNVYMSSRNIPGVEVLPFGEESAFDVLWSDVVIIEAPALERASEVAHA